MTFSIHLDESLAERLNRTAKESGKARNALIREAVREWLDRRRPREWPPEVMDFRGAQGIARFEHARKRLKPPRDPFRSPTA
jgi:Arc/MetJ-type ribon-helix-helix transcriptional regulator